jgi:hypothetical protein
MHLATRRSGDEGYASVSGFCEVLFFVMFAIFRRLRAGT